MPEVVTGHISRKRYVSGNLFIESSLFRTSKVGKYQPTAVILQQCLFKRGSPFHILIYSRFQMYMNAMQTAANSLAPSRRASIGNFNFTWRSALLEPAYTPLPKAEDV